MKEVKETADQIRAKVTAEENKMIDAIKTLERDRMAAFDEHEKAVGYDATKETTFSGHGQ